MIKISQSCLLKSSADQCSSRMSHGVFLKVKPEVDQGSVDVSPYPNLNEAPIGPSFGPGVLECDLTHDEQDAQSSVVYPSSDPLQDISLGAPGHRSPLYGESMEGEDVPVGIRFGPGVLEMDIQRNLYDESSGGEADAETAQPLQSPLSIQTVASLMSTARSLEGAATHHKSTDGSLLSKGSIVSMANLKRSDMCQHLQHVKDMTFKRRLRISGVLCSLGIFFVMSGVGVVVGTMSSVNAVFGDMIRSVAISFLLFGLVSFVLALLPTDQRAVPVSAGILCGMLLSFGGFSMMFAINYLFNEQQTMQAGSAAVIYAKGIAIAFGGVLFFGLAFYLLIQLIRPRTTRRLLSRMWYVCKLFFAVVACLCISETYVDTTQNGPTGLFYLVATTGSILCMLISRNKQFRNQVQNFIGAYGESAGSAAAVAALVGSRDVDEVLEMARCSFYSVKADRLKQEHIANNIPDPSLGIGMLARRTRLGEADAFISHCWKDDPTMKWNAIQAWRERFKSQHHTEPRLWMDKYCMDQEDFQNSLACLPIYLASCSKMVVICGESYLTRLWCVIELFVFLEMGGSPENLEVILLPDPEERIAVQIRDFEPANLQCSRADTADLLQSVLEAGSGGLDGIRRLVREQFAPKAGRAETTSTAATSAESPKRSELLQADRENTVESKDVILSI